MANRKARPPRRNTRPSRAPSLQEQFREALSRLWGVSSEASAVFDQLTTSEDPSATPGHEHVLGYLASWTRYVDNGATAVQHLERTGLGVYAAPIRRNLLEHAVTCATVANNADAFDSYVRSHKHSVSKIITARGELGLDSDEATVSRIMDWNVDDATKPLDVMAQAKVKFNAFEDGGNALYLQWLTETLISHAGFPTAVLHLRDTPGDDYPTLTIEPMVTESEWGVAAICGDALLLCLQSFSSVIVGDPLRDAVAALKRRKHELLDEVGELLAAGVEPDSIREGRVR